MRTCLGCGQKQSKREMIRIVRSPEGEIFLDPTGKKNGRGCYICKKTECLQNLIKQRKLAKSFETAVEPEVYGKLKAEFEAWRNENGGNSIG